MRKGGKLIFFKWFSFFILLISFNAVYAQNPDPDPDPSPIPYIDTSNPCESIEIKNTAVIKTESGQIVYMRFANEIPQKYILVDNDGREADAQVCEDTDGDPVMIITTTESEGELSLIAPNSCGEPQIIMAINKRVEHEIGGSQITVSEELHKLLKNWTKSSTPLLEFLKKDSDINIYEKVAFYQEYALGNLPMQKDGRFGYEEIQSDDDIPQELRPCTPPDLPSDPPVVTDTEECRCETLVVAPKHLKGERHTGTVFGDGYEYNFWNYLGFNETPKQDIPGQSNASYWVNNKILGASSWTQLVTEGWKTNPNQFKEWDYESGTEGSNGVAQGYITITLMCQDGQELPAECHCDKSGTVQFYYESTVSAEAHLKGNNGGRHAKASVQNQAVAYYFENNDIGANVEAFFPVQAFDIGAASECEAEINQGFFEAAGMLANGVIGAFTNQAGQLGRWDVTTTCNYDTLSINVILADTLWVSDSSSFTIIPERITYQIDSTKVRDSVWVFSGPSGQGSAYTAIVNGIVGLIGEPLHDYKDCNAAEQTALINTNRGFTIGSNETLTFGVMSTYKLNSGGKRSWGAETKLNSSYSISLHILPGSDGPERPDPDCCIPHVGAYLIAPGYWHWLNGQVNSSINDETYNGLFSTSGFTPNNSNGLVLDPVNGIHLGGQSGYISRPPDASGPCDQVDIVLTPRSNQLSDAILNDYFKGKPRRVRAYDVVGHMLLDEPIGIDITKQEVIELVRGSLQSKYNQQLVIINFINKKGQYENAKIFL